MLLDHLPGIYARFHEHYKGREVDWSITVAPMRRQAATPMLTFRVRTPFAGHSHTPPVEASRVLTGASFVAAGEEYEDYLRRALEEILHTLDERLAERPDLATQGRAWP